MPDRTYYVIADDNCKFESMTKEQILAAITQAVEGHSISDVDTGFVTTIKERNKNIGLKFWIGTTAEYNAIAQKEENCFYILSDDTELEDIETTVNNLHTVVDNLANSVSDLQSDLDELDEVVTDIDDDLRDYKQEVAQDVSDLQDADTALSGRVSDLETKLITNYDANIYNGTMVYADTCSVSLLKSVNDYRVFNIHGIFEDWNAGMETNVICVRDGSNHIYGTGYINYGNTGSVSEINLLNIALTVNSAGTTVTQNHSAGVIMDKPNVVDLDFHKVKITRIDGII